VISPVHCLWFAAIPIFDCLTCFARRAMKGKSPFSPGRDHFHHMLFRGGFTVRPALAILTGLQLIYALIALLSVAVISGDEHASAAAAMTVSAAIIGFLIFNFPTPWNRLVRSFMGDAGSTMLGFTVVWITLGVSQGEARVISPVHCLWFAAVPIFDCLTCFVRRAMKGKSPFSPGRDHFHHMLFRGGFTVRPALAILTGLQLTYALIAIAAHFAGVADVIMFTAWSLLFVTQRTVIRQIGRYHRCYKLRKVRRLRTVAAA
jgi:UDP-GlcNAc:undecaprenyl-phosphate GlcNAc-1-phosphate transferase